MSEEKLTPVNGVHGTIVECTSDEEANEVSRYVSQSSEESKFIDYKCSEEEPIYIGTNTNNGLYCISYNHHPLAGETISFEDFLKTQETIDIYKLFKMEKTND